MPHGIFVDLRSHWFARLGSANVSFARQQGGVLAIGSDTGSVPPAPARGIAPAHLLRLGARMRLVCRSDPGSADYGQSVLVRQENDPAPKCHFLEEGPVRLGMRVAFDLLDDEGHYLGDGRQDVWLYAEGDVHVTWALNTVDLAGQVTRAKKAQVRRESRQS